MREFKINHHLSLRLENDSTYIYVDDKRFLQCLRLVLTIPKHDLSAYDEVDSIDEAASLYKSLYKNKIYEGPSISPISPEEEFIGHCSNLQAWVENDYDTRILHSKLAFPLLWKLTNAGDPIAQRVFKEEIAKRFQSDYEPVKEYLVTEGYLDYLSNEELEAIGAETYQSKKLTIINELLKLKPKFGDRRFYHQFDIEVLQKLEREFEKQKDGVKIPITRFHYDYFHNHKRRFGDGAVA